MNIPATPLRKLPIKIHSFEKLRSEGYLYIHRDKNTDFAAHLVDERLKDKVMSSDNFRSGDLMIQLK